MITNDAVVLGILFMVLGLIFKTSTSQNPFFQKFYSYIPPLLLCYFIPGLLNTFGIINGEKSNLYSTVSQYFLPATLVYFTLSMDFSALQRLGKKAIFVFLAGSLGIMIGGPVALFIVKSFNPSVLGGTGADASWRGLATIAGSWIGGGANQTALKEVFKPSPVLFSQVIAVDVIVAEIWMAVLIFAAGKTKLIDKWLQADTTEVDFVRDKIEKEQHENNRIPSSYDLMMIAVVGFSCTGIAHFGADNIAPFIQNNYPFLVKFSLASKFFWVVGIVTLLGICLSFTDLRKLEYAGASKIGGLLLYVLVATIGMNMNITAALQNPSLFLVGIIWMSIHAIIIVLASKALKAPFFFTAVGSQANVGGAASAPIVAAVFHPSLASVGVLLAILGYALGTYCGFLTGLMMQWIAE